MATKRTTTRLETYQQRYRELARQLAEAIWQMLTRDQPFAPAGATPALAA